MFSTRRTIEDYPSILIEIGNLGSANDFGRMLSKKMFGETDWIFYLISSDALNSKKKRPNEDERIERNINNLCIIVGNITFEIKREIFNFLKNEKLLK
jgi:hypothetical protein